MCVCVCICMYVCNGSLRKKNLKERKEGYIIEFEGRKGKIM